MTITVQWYAHKQGTFEPDYDKRTVKNIIGKNAKECMEAIQFIRDNHDLVLFTPTEIINVED